MNVISQIWQTFSRKVAIFFIFRQVSMYQRFSATFWPESSTVENSSILRFCPSWITARHPELLIFAINYIARTYSLCGNSLFTNWIEATILLVYLIYSLCHGNGSFSVTFFNHQYLSNSIPQCTVSWGNHFQETHSL